LICYHQGYHPLFAVTKAITRLSGYHQGPTHHPDKRKVLTIARAFIGRRVRPRPGERLRSSAPTSLAPGPLSRSSLAETPTPKPRSSLSVAMGMVRWGWVREHGPCFLSRFRGSRRDGEGKVRWGWTGRGRCGGETLARLFWQGLNDSRLLPSPPPPPPPPCTSAQLSLQLCEHHSPNSLAV